MAARITPAEAFRMAAAAAVTQSALARVLNKKQPAISKRLKAGKPAEPDEVLAIENAYGISRHDLRPDLYPREEAQGAADPATRFEAAR